MEISCFFLVFFKIRSLSLFICRDLKRPVFSKMGEIWPYFMKLLEEGEREQERNFPSGCTDEILLCGVLAYSW